MQRLSAERSVRLGFRMIVVDPASIPDDVVRLHVEGVLARGEDPEGPEAFLGTARSMLRLGRRPEIAARAMDAIRCPVLVIHGRRDRFVPARFAEATLARFPTWRGRILPDVGHAPQLEVPGRWLAEVADWYAERVDRP
jgi:pimeloyl-ACP methyl ester carboxylesterase